MRSTRQIILALHKQGLLNSRIAEGLGVSKQYVSAVLTKPVEPKRARKPERIIGEGLVAPRVLSQALGIHINTVRRWADRGVLPCLRIGTCKHRRFRIADLPSEYASVIRHWLDGQK
jgi:hypothetical protein